MSSDIIQSVTIGPCTLYLGDCLKIAPTLQFVDAVVTDPPFEKEAHTMERRKLGRVTADGREILNDSLPFEAITSETRAKISAAVAKMCPGWAIVFCQAEAVSDWRDSFEAAGAKYKRAMVWIKPDGMPQFSGDRPGMGYESIVAVWCGPGKSHWNGGGRNGVFTWNKNDAVGPAPHPTTKPRKLMCELVTLFSDSANTIFDPFMGSGTTGIACIRTGRRFIGIEIDPKHFRTACDRIQREVDQYQLPLAPAPQPTQADLIA